MKPDTKALVYNFISFGLLFLIVRYVLMFFMDASQHILLVIFAAVIATVVSPKFFVMKMDGKPTVMMKVLFVKKPFTIG